MQRRRWTTDAAGDDAWMGPSPPAAGPPARKPSPWQPTHRLRWIPRAGVAREWLVQVVTNGVGHEAVTVAETLEEAQAGRLPSWALVDGAWLWKGGGWNGEDGVAMAVPIAGR